MIRLRDDFISGLGSSTLFIIYKDPMNISNFFDRSSISQFLSNLSRQLSTPIAQLSPVILATSFTALVGLGAYRWSQKNQDKSVDIQDASFEKGRERIARTYAYVFGGFSLTAASAVVSHISGLSLHILNNSNYIVPTISFLSCGALVTTLWTSKEDQKTKHIAWGVFNGCIGLALSTLGFLNQDLIAQAAFISLGLGGLLTLTARLAPNERFLKWEGPLMAALTSLSVASFVAIFFPHSAFAYGVDRASLYGGLLIFSGLFMANTQDLLNKARTQSDQEFDPINSSIGIYLDSLNIFIRILKILVENKVNEKK